MSIGPKTQALQVNGRQALMQTNHNGQWFNVKLPQGQAVSAKAEGRQVELLPTKYITSLTLMRKKWANTHRNSQKGIIKLSKMITIKLFFQCAYGLTQSIHFLKTSSLCWPNTWFHEKLAGQSVDIEWKIWVPAKAKTHMKPSYDSGSHNRICRSDQRHAHKCFPCEESMYCDDY